MKRSTLIPIALGTLALLLAGGGYWWGFMEFEKVRAASVTVAADIANASALHEQGTRARGQEVDLAAQEASIAEHIVRPESIVSFLGDIESTGRRYGTSVAVASVGDIEKDGRILVSLTVTGTFDGVMRTLAALEHGTYALAAKSVTIDTREEGWGLSGTFYVVATPQTP